MDFLEFTSSTDLMLCIAPVPDGSMSISFEDHDDDFDPSWGWTGDTGERLEQIRRNEPDRIFTVVDTGEENANGESVMHVIRGYHVVNRMFYLVTDQPYDGPLNTWEY